MVNYTSFRLLAERLIGENGRALTLRRVDQTNAEDPLKPWRAPASMGSGNVSLPVVGVFTEYDKEDIDGTLVRAGDKRVLVAAKDTEDAQTGSENIIIEDFDTILDGTTVWKIIKVSVIEPGSLRVLYDIQARR